MTIELLDRLRKDTAVYHEQIEGNFYAKGIMAKTLTLDEYRTYLAKFYGFLQPLEQQAIGHMDALESDSGFDMNIRAKSPLLEQDLIHLGMSIQEIRQLPLCTDLPDISTPARMYGAFYVIEGSTLGGQIITKQLMKFLPVDPEGGLHYFNAYGAETREQWSAFRDLLLQAGVTEENKEQIIYTAKETFRLLDLWLSTDPN
ncbi:biliverdin-producing heme oxygenase [Paenibacillus sp. KACC 21273]|uniref:biliverdin-producing heme oxygenase n=1 Tax=Paenibacillus sp. KACC 21273 TaxID=3025665 RepID=UPI002366D3E4|nr:biliverdin-producing heme oxygenase [Paenibacillus sp. KACC 21273]WDF50138.1 biliverdin-producing heme oxygenase [Paenibacillus sp. KACC 21273]